MKSTASNGNLSGAEKQFVPLGSEQVSEALTVLKNIVRHISPVTWPTRSEPSAEDIFNMKQLFVEIILFEMRLKGFGFRNDNDISHYVEASTDSHFYGRLGGIRLYPVVNFADFDPDKLLGCKCLKDNAGKI